MIRRKKMDEFTQFSIKAETKDVLDRYKTLHKDAILKAFQKKKRYVTNDMAIGFLLRKVGAE